MAPWHLGAMVRRLPANHRMAHQYPEWAALRRLEHIAPDRAAEASWRARARVRKALPRQINEALKTGRELVKEAKGLKD
jgi:hypothetical protein